MSIGEERWRSFSGNNQLLLAGCFDSQTLSENRESIASLDSRAPPTLPNPPSRKRTWRSPDIHENEAQALIEKSFQSVGVDDLDWKGRRRAVPASAG